MFAWSCSDVPFHRQSEDEILFEVGYGMSADSIARAFRAKLKGLQKEMEALQIDYNKQVCHKFWMICLGNLSKYFMSLKSYKQHVNKNFY
jgi:hypothetical protein